MTTEKFSLRKLTAQDIFPVCDIIGKCGVSEFKNCFLKQREGEYRNAGIAVVFEIAGIICRNISSCEKELFSFLSDISGIDEKELRQLEMSEFACLLKAVISKEEMKDFFTAASGFFLTD